MYQELLHNEAETESDFSDEQKAPRHYRDVRPDHSDQPVSKFVLILLVASAIINIIAILLLVLTYTTQKSGDLGIDPSVFLLNTTSTDHHAFSSNHTAGGMHNHSSNTAMVSANMANKAVNTTASSTNKAEELLPKYLFPSSVVAIKQSKPDEPQGIDYNVILAKGVRSIMEYRTPNIPLEKCYAKLFIPEKEELNGKNVTLMGNTTVDMWLLKSGNYDSSTTVWNKRPEREAFLGSKQASLGSHAATDVFPCTSNATLTVEYSCPSPDCHIEFFQEFTYPMLVFEVVAYQ